MPDAAPPPTPAAPAAATPPEAAPPPPTEGVDPPAPADGAKTAEDPKAAEKAPPPPSALERAKAAAERAKRARQEKEQLRAQSARAAHELAQHQAQLRQLAEERQALAQQLERAKADPLAYLREAGVTADTLARQAIADASPEAKYERELAAHKEMIAELKQRIEQREAETAKAQEASRRQAAEAGFLELAKDAGKYPFLAGHVGPRGRALVREAVELVNDARRRSGDPEYAPSDEEVLSVLNQIYGGAHAPAQKPAQQTQAPDKSTPSEGTDGIGTGGQDAPAGKSRTLNSKLQTRGSVPKGPELMDRDEEREHFARMYEGLKGKSASR